jgi:radical SAM superfamily enzyme YgiQ (UPF0313 family)
MGIQSGSEEILESFHRPVAQEKAIEAANTIIECGIECYFDMITKVHFEREEHCRQTFEFLLRFPQQVKSIGFAAMVSFPAYGYTKKVEDERRTLSVSDELYAYYHKLYLLTRTTLPRRVVQAIGNSRVVRRFPSLIDRLLPEKLPAFFLLDDDGPYAGQVIDNPQAQAVIPGGTLDRGLPAEGARA